jgi:hypothetical protein
MRSIKLILVQLFLVLSFNSFSFTNENIYSFQQSSKTDTVEKKLSEVGVLDENVLKSTYKLDKKNTRIERTKPPKERSTPRIDQVKPINKITLNEFSVDTLKTTRELNSIKFALGNYFHTEIETNIVNNNQKNGFSFAHNSFQTGATKNWYSKRYGNKLSGFANFEPFQKLNFENKFSFQNQGSFYYGNESAETLVRNKANKFDYRTLVYEGKLSNEFTSNNVEWEGLFSANKLDGIQDLGETNINGQLNLKAYVANGVKLTFTSSITNSHFKNTLIDLKRTLIFAQPTINYKSGNYHLEAGVSYVNDQTATKEYFFPKIEFGYKLNDNHQLIAGFTGDVQFNNFQSLLRENIYLNNNLSSFTNTSSPTQIYAILKGGNSSDVEETRYTYVVKLKYAQINNLPIFIHGGRNSDRDPLVFTPEYIGQLSSVSNFQIDANFDKKFNQNLSTSLNLKTNNFTGDIQYSNILLRPLIDLNYQITYQGLNWDFSPNIGFTSGLFGYQTKSNQVVKMENISLVNLNVGYRLTRTFRMFSNWNNLLNQKYQRIINYREIGFNFNAGILYAF